MSSKYGSIHYSPSAITVDSYATWSLVYKVGKVGLKSGGRVRIGIFGKFSFDDFQGHDETQKNYISAVCSKESTKVRVNPDLIRNGTQYWEITVDVMEGNLGDGDTLTVTFGDKQGSGPGFRVRNHAQKLLIALWIDPIGNHDYIQVPDVPRYTFQPKPMKKMQFIAPSSVRMNEPFRCVIRYVDCHGNIIDPNTILKLSTDSFEFSFRSLNGSRLASVHYTVSVEDTVAETLAVTITVSELGVKAGFVVEVKDNLDNCAKSNPLTLVDISKGSHYWGEIHGHSLLSDGQLLPDEYLRFARDREALDFSAISDHDTHMMRREIGGEDRYLLSPYWREPLAPWHIIKYETERFNTPGSFVTLLGYEWTSGHCFTPKDLRFGHKNVYYLNNDEMLYSHVDPESDTPTKLGRCLAGRDAIVIPHHSTRPIGCSDQSDVNSIVSGVDWRFHNESVERLVEIYSKWGNSETHDGRFPVVDSGPEGAVQTALALGCRLGFTGGSDTHACWPGSSVLEEGGLLQYRSGLTCVVADGLSRQDVFFALYERRCYATTGERIVVDFTVNGYPLGQEIVARSGDTANVKAKVLLTSQSGIVEIIRNNEVVASFNGGQEITVDWTDKKTVDDVLVFSHHKRPAERFGFYYLRVTQDSGDMAWVSPVWFVG